MMNRIPGVLLLGLFLVPSDTRAQEFSDFSDFLARYEGERAETRPEIVRAFIAWQNSRGGFPIVGAAGEVVFVHFGDMSDSTVQLVGDFKPRSPIDVYWSPEGETLERVGSTVFYLRRTFEPDARIDYGFRIDGALAVDRMNPRRIVSGPAGGVEVSELVMPIHRLPEEPIERAGVPSGTLHGLTEPWMEHRVTVYLPPGYDSSRTYSVLYTADGSAWAELIRLPTILDNLIAAGRIEPIIAVMIDSAPDRSAWYSYNPEYLEYLVRVVEYVDARYATRPLPTARVHAGTSAGGRATAYVGFEIPNLFHNLGLLSPSFSGPIYYWEPYFSGQSRPNPNLRIWMSAGTYEGYIHRDTQTMQRYFERVGIPVESVFFHQGHSFGAWREASIEMLEHFFRVGR